MRKLLFIIAIAVPANAFAWPNMKEDKLVEFESDFAKVYRKPSTVNGPDGLPRVNTQTDHEFFEEYMSKLVKDTAYKAIRIRNIEAAEIKTKQDIEAKENEAK